MKNLPKKRFCLSRTSTNDRAPTWGFYGKSTNERAPTIRYPKWISQWEGDSFSRTENQPMRERRLFAIQNESANGRSATFLGRKINQWEGAICLLPKLNPPMGGRQLFSDWKSANERAPTVRYTEWIRQWEGGNFSRTENQPMRGRHLFAIQNESANRRPATFFGLKMNQWESAYLSMDWMTRM